MGAFEALVTLEVVEESVIKVKEEVVAAHRGGSEAMGTSSG